MDSKSKDFYHDYLQFRLDFTRMWMGVYPNFDNLVSLNLKILLVILYILGERNVAVQGKEWVLNLTNFRYNLYQDVFGYII